MPGGCARLVQASCSCGVWKTVAGLLDLSQNVNLIFNLLALIALCHADLIVKHRFVCFLTTQREKGKAIFLSWLKALTDKAPSEKCELGN